MFILILTQMLMSRYIINYLFELLICLAGNIKKIMFTTQIISKKHKKNLKFLFHANSFLFN